MNQFSRIGRGRGRGLGGPRGMTKSDIDLEFKRKQLNFKQLQPKDDESSSWSCDSSSLSSTSSHDDQTHLDTFSNYSNLTLTSQNSGSSCINYFVKDPNFVSSWSLEAAEDFLEEEPLVQFQPRVIRELGELHDLSLDDISWTIDEDVPELIHFILIGGPGSLYDGIKLELDVRFSEEYPVYPPEVRFISKIKRSRIRPNGKVLLPELLEGGWRPWITLSWIIMRVKRYIDDLDFDPFSKRKEKHLEPFKIDELHEYDIY